jgi:hypothetical protein
MNCKKLALSGLCSLLTALAADQVIGGPMAIKVTQRSATVVCVVQTGTATLSTASDEKPRTAPALRADKHGFSNLQPGTTYTYNCAGNEGSFKTAPAKSEPYDFVVFGDTRTRHELHRRIIAGIMKNGAPDFVLHTGDLVTDGTDSAQWPTFFEIEREMLRKTAFFPALGNHERNSRLFYEFFDIGDPYYSFNWGDSHFVVLNSDIGNVASSPSAKDEFWTKQRKWLEEDLAANQKAAFRFIVAHHPPITAVSSRQGGNKEMTALIPLFEKYKVTAGFFGHDHNYQHFLKDGIHYIVTGGGGAPLYDVGKPPEGITVKVVSTEHFVKIHVENGVAKMTAVGIDGTVLDTFEVR